MIVWATANTTGGLALVKCERPWDVHITSQYRTDRGAWRKEKTARPTRHNKLTI